MKLFSKDSAEQKGIAVNLKKTDYQGIETDNVQFEVIVSNRLLDEVFIEVTELEHAKISVQGENGAMSSGVGTTTRFPDNTQLLKRLHAATISKDGDVLGCSCSTTTIKQSAKLDLSDWIGSKGILSFTVSGFYRSTGKQFSSTIELPFNIIKTANKSQ